MTSNRPTASTITDDDLDKLIDNATKGWRRGDRWKEKATELEAERDGAYRERAHLLAWLAALHPASAVIAPALDVQDEGWAILYLVAGGWQMSWHIAPQDLHLFERVPRVPADDPRAQWDGHTTEAKYTRMRSHTRLLAMGALTGEDGAPVCTCTVGFRCPVCAPTEDGEGSTE